MRTVSDADRNEEHGSRTDYLEKGKIRAKAKKKPKVTIALPDEISGECGDDFSPLDATAAGGSSYRAYFVAKKTWQIASACEEMRYVEVNDSLSYLLFDGHKEEDVEAQYGGEVIELH